MSCRVTNPISIKDFTRIREAEAKIKMLRKINDSNWISEDVEDFTCRYSPHWIDLIGEEHEVGSISKKVLPFILPISKCFNEFFIPNNLKNCMKIYSGKSFFTMKPDFRIAIPGFTVAHTGILFDILQENEKELFTFGPFFSIKDQEVCPTQKNIIYEFTKIFYVRKKLYHEIFNILSNDRDKFADSFGEKFINDLILLFSASVIEENIPNFDFFSNKFGDSLFCQKFTRNDLEWHGNYYSPDFEEEGKEFAWNVGRDNEFWVYSGKNTFITSWQHSDIPPFTGGLADKYAFIDMRLNNIMKQMVAFADFGMRIYEKVKNRILIKNI
jgi:hypothetical protein